MLTAKAREQEETMQEYMTREIQFQKFEREFQKISEELQKLKEAQTKLSTEKEELQHHCSKIEKEKETAEEDKEYLVGILADATHVLKQTLQVRKKVFVHIFNYGLYS